TNQDRHILTAQKHKSHERASFQKEAGESPQNESGSEHDEDRGRGHQQAPRCRHQWPVVTFNGARHNRKRRKEKERWGWV
ncbi:hypothetical protein TorRG33x02_166230, partial [Trema orientale]